MKSIVITGSTRGIGFGLADAFLRLGCQVMLSGRQQPAVDQALTRLAERFPAERIAGQPCDITDIDQVQRLWDAAKARFGQVDIWVNNAGMITARKPLWQQQPAELEQIVTTNITGMMYCCSVAIRGMLDQGGGHIYNMEGLGSGGEIMVGSLPYGSTKYAVRYLTKALIKETRGLNVKVSTISPGMVLTDLLLNNTTPEQQKRSRRIFNILADKVETVAPWLAERMLANDRAGARFAWLTTPKIAARFALAPFRKRDIVP